MRDTRPTIARPSAGVRDEFVVPSDDLLVAAAIGGNPESFGDLFTRHASRVLTHCYRLVGDRDVSEDLTSVVFLEAWRRRDGIRFVEGSALPWLLVTATNVARNHRRSLRRYRAALQRLPAAGHIPDIASDIAARLDAEGDNEQLRQALGCLPRVDRDVVALSLIGELRHEEVGEVLGLSPAAVRNRLSRARRALRVALVAARQSAEVVADA